MECNQIIFSAHSLRSMISRSISVEEVTEVVKTGEVIMRYETDKPYPSKLVHKFVGNKHVHVVIAENLETLDCILVTCYIPDPVLWDADFRTKIK